jgi:2-polyprenyl-3-methyl-5-hydroxy-6-metoxy-1,4-benzoquinol methylase
MDPNYGSDYQNWKKWQDGFGLLDDDTRYYFDAEMRRAGFNCFGPLKVLEIGFGNGLFLRYANEKGWEVHGVEANSELVENALQAGFVAIGPTELSRLEVASYDLIVAFDVLEHISANEAVSFLGDLLRLLKKGGQLIARFPNGDSPFGLVSQNGDVTHLNAIGSRKIEYYSSVLGVELVSCVGQVIPLKSARLDKTIRRASRFLVSKLVDWLVNVTFLPGMRVKYTANCLVAILRKPG